MFSTPEFWVFIAFLVFLAAVGQKAYHFFTTSLDAHRQKVAKQLEEAQHLHDEALSLLNSYKEKHKKAIDQAEQIISFAEAEAERFKKTSEKAFEKFVAQKEKSFLEQITNDKKEAQSKLKQQITDEALKIVEHVLSKEEKKRKIITAAALKEVADVSLDSKT